MSGNGGGGNKNDGLASLFKSMGGGGDDCDRPACDDTKSALTAALQRVGQNKQHKKGDAAAASSGDSKNKEEEKKDGASPDRYTACPPTRDEIGVSTWNLLHSMVRVFDVLHHTFNFCSADVLYTTHLIC